MYKQLQTLLVLFTLLFSFVELSAKTCDENISKALEQTRITTFSYVTKGDTAEFVIRYPLAGTKYTLRDQAGNVYNYTYTGNPAKIAIPISVGVVNTTRKFSFTAEKGSCSYSSDFIYTITPQTTPDLSVRVENEWCERAGGIFFKLIGTGVDDTKYNFYLKNSTETDYDRAKLLSPNAGVEAIAAGSYDLVAELKTDTSKKIEKKNIIVASEVTPIEYKASFAPALCEGQLGGIKVKVTKGTYPLFFTLLKEDGTEYSNATTRQISNIFTNIPAGTYKVRVEDYCAIGGGNAPQPQVVIVKNYHFQLKNFQQVAAWEYGCDYAAFGAIWIEVDNLAELLATDAFPYPYTFKLDFQSPDGNTYSKTYLITNRRDFDNVFGLATENNVPKYLQLRNNIRENYPMEGYGDDWAVQARIISSCGESTPIQETASIEDPLRNIDTVFKTLGTGCRSQVLRRSDILLGQVPQADDNIPVYFVLENYPLSFNPEAAGFYKIATTNTYMANKYLKRIDVNGVDLIASEFLNTGDKFRFRVVYESCNREQLLPEITVPNTAAVASEMYYHAMPSCKNVTATGTEYASLAIEHRSGNPIRQIRITAYDGDPSKLPAGVTIPYTLPESTHISNYYWYVSDLPQGNYTIEHTNECNAVGTVQFALYGDPHTITWVEGCVPKLIFDTTKPQTKGYLSYEIQRFNEGTQSWERVEFLIEHSGSRTIPITGNTRGKFRLIRSSSAKAVLAGLNTPRIECTQVLSEKEFSGSMLEPKVFGLGCPSKNVHHVLVEPNGGVPPYTYKLVSKEIVGQTPEVLDRVGDDENFFLSLDASNATARYVFQVTDACGEAKTVDYRVSNFVPPVLTAEHEYYCVGQSARLSIPKMGNNVRINWYRSDNLTTPVATNTNTLYIANLTAADFANTYSVKLTGNYGADVNVCIANTTLHAYQFREATHAIPSFTMPAQTGVATCVTAGGGEVYYNLKNLFTKPAGLAAYLAANPSVREVIEDPTGAISVPANGIVNLNSPELGGRETTFVYTIKTACDEVLLQATNTLKVSPKLVLTTNEVNTCAAAPTYDEVKQHILQANENIRTMLVTFEWYLSEADALAGSNKQIGTTTIPTIAEGASKTLYLRYAKNNFCNSDVIPVKVNRLAVPTLSATNLGAICTPNVENIKKLIDATNFADIIIYHNNDVLVDTYELTNDTDIYYAKRIADCQTAKAKLSFTVQPITQTEAKVLTLCPLTFGIGGYQYVTIEQVKTKLKELYPNAEADGVTLYRFDFGTGRYSLYTDINNRIPLGDVLYYTLKENGKCVSSRKTVTFAAASQTTANSIAVTLCENTTIADLKAKITGNNKKIFKDNVEQTDATSIDWDMANKYSYSLTDSDSCESNRAFITLTKSADTTPITPKAVTFCNGVAQTVANLKAQLNDSSAKVYLRNVNRYDEQLDATVLNENLTYYYTVQAAGKCISEKAPIALTITQSTPTPQGPNSTTGCIKTVGDLRSYIRTQDSSRSTDDLAIYAGLLDTNKGAALADSTTLTQTTYSYAYTAAGKCESAVRHITISRVATPTVTQTAHTLCGGGSQTIASLQPQGANIVWYNSATGGSPLASTTPLVAGTTYYVAQKSGNCESERVAVTVTQGASGNETLNFQSSNNSLNCIPTGQLRFQIQNAQAGNTYVVELIEAPATYTGTRTFTVTETDKDGITPFVKFTGYNMPAGNYKAKLHSCSVANSQPVPATIGKLQSDFPASDRRNNDFGNDQVYRDIQSGGQPSCDYLDIRYSNNANSPFYKYFNTPELLALYEYTAYSDDDLANKYGGNHNHPNIVWRPLFSVPAGKTSAQKMIYYDLQAHNRTYKDLKEDPNKLPKFYFRIKGQTCTSVPMLVGDIRFMNTGIVFAGTCQAPEMLVTAENQMVCYPVKYVINENGTKVAEGEITYATERKNVTTLAGGQTFKRNQHYQVVFTSQDGQVQTQTDSFDDFYNKIRPGGGYKEQARCFGSNEAPKGNIQVYHRVNQSGTLYSMNGFKVTLLQAPTGYTNEPGKLRLNETVTIQYTDPNRRATNIMATDRQDDMTQMFTLPEGTYKIKVEDTCGNVTYLYSGTDSTRQQFDLVYPSYQEKPLTPETRTECTKVKVYPFKGNAAFDWLQAEGRNRSVYVYLYRRPTGINPGDVTVSSNLSQQVGATTYIKAVYNPNDPTSADQYFSLPRNQNSEGSYTFVYGGKIDINSNEQDIISYIASSGTNGCVRTFTISIDDVLLNFDRNGYIGYKCEDNTGKIVVKAINGIGGSGNYQYELYDRKEGTRIDTQTAAKGSTVTFTNLGTFSAGQNTRWVKIIDSECPTDPVWKELPITPLDNPELVLASPLQSGYCKGSTVTITLRSLGAPSYQWKYPDGTTTVTTLPQLVIPSINAQHAGIYQVVAQGLVCAANTVTFSYTVNILEAPATGKTYTLCAAATITDLKAKIATDTATVRVYKNGTLVTDNTESLSTTDTYKVSRFNAVCETDKVVVTIVFSNTVTLTVPTALTVTCTATNIDTVVSNWLNQATVTDTCGTATLTHNFTAVKPTNWCGAGVVTVTFVARDPQGNTVTKTSLIKVGNTPLVATPDTDFTFPSGSATSTSTRTVIDNDRIGNRTPTTSDVVITTGTTTTDVVGQTNTPTIDTATGKVTVPSGTKSGTYTLTYTICERLNPGNCKTATVTVKVGNTPLVATPDTDFTFPSGSATGTSTRTVIDNDRIGNRTPTTSDVVITTGTTTTDVVGQTNTPTIDTTTGKVTVPSGTKSGTYTLTYTICERLNPDNCKTTTVTVKVGNTPLVATPDTDFTFPSGSVTGTSTRTVIDNDRIGNRTPTTSDVVITTGTTTTDVVGQTNTPTIDTTTGKVTVPSGTKSGTYTLTYTICERLNPDNCKTATVTVKVGSTPLVATPDTDFTFPSGSATGTSTRTVIDNDRIGNRTPTTNDVVITTGTTTTDVVGQTNTPTIDTTTGKVTVPSGTKSGTYTLTYTICERLNPDNCKTATVTVKVGNTPLVATPDTDFTFPSGSVTGTSTRTVIDNDRIGNRTPTTSDVVITTGTTTTDVVGQTNTPTIDTTTGKVTVPAGTKSGTYTLTYTICERLNPDNCKTTTVTVKVGNTPLVATPDTDFTFPSGSTTGTSTRTVIDNDRIGNRTPTTSDVVITTGTTTTDVVGQTNTPTIDTTTGKVTVPSGTKSGTYTLTYTICERLNPDNCKTTTVTVKVGNTPLVATPDTDFTFPSGSTTGTSTRTVIDNDRIGNRTPTTSDVVITTGTTTTDVVGQTNTPTIDTTTGKVTVPAGTKSGTYTLTYTICERLNPDNCKTATVTVKVGNTPLVATPDTDFTFPSGSVTGTSTRTVIDNDRIGNRTPTTSDVVITTGTTTTDVVGQTNTPTIDTTTGKVTVPSGTKSGTYTLTYTICERLNPDNCKTATVTVKVGNTPLVATPDTDFTFPSGSATGTSTRTVIDNDRIGNRTPTTSDVVITTGTTTTDVVGQTNTPTIDTTTGKVTVPSGTKSGTYTLTYTICERLNPDNCKTATVTVKVGSTPLVATPDTDFTFPSGSVTGTSTRTVIDNDRIGNRTPTTSDVVITTGTTTTDVVGQTNTPTIDTTTGKVTVPSGTKSGTYTLTYTICERLNPDNCKTATVTVKVGNTPLVATPDTDFTFPSGSATGTSTRTVIDNDRIGNRTPTTSDVVITTGTTTTDVVGQTNTPTIDTTTGKVTVPSGTKSGTYTLTYTICERLNPDNCKTTTVTVKVGSTTTPTTIEANDDVATVSSTTGGTTSSVLTNDKLNGVPNPSVSSVTLTWTTATPTGFTLNPNGTITIAPNTSAGTYTISYKICAVASSMVCDNANIVVTVTGTTTSTTTPTTIEANDDVATVSSTTGGTTSSVLTNDKLNGVPNPSVSSVTLTWTTATPTGFTLNPNGTITIAPNTSAGTYTISYKICAVASSTVCDNANIVVTVTGTTTSTTPVLPIATDDRTTTPIDTPVVVNVLANDTLNGATAPNVVTNPTNGTTVVNPDGTIEYRPHTGFEGIDTFVYELCNTDGCASATVTIEVISKLIPYNGMSVDDDGKNEHFHIGGINRYPDNVVRIYNRWGVKVFEAEGYNNVTCVFRGFSNGRVVVGTSDKLPQGTYYYVIEYVDENKQKRSEVGWLYLKR